MRAVTVVMLIALSACGGPVTGGQDTADAGDAARASLESEAGKVCAGMTGYSTEAMQDKPADTQALFAREFKRCVEAVGKGEAPGPALRGKTDAL